MKLHDNKQAFRDLIIITSNYYGLNPSIVEKDYYVTLILKEASKEIPGILFRGGTCLSKCFKIIKRFSEDIDLTLNNSHFTLSNKRNANYSIMAICDKLGLNIFEKEKILSRRHYNCYNIEYPYSFLNNELKSYIKLELTFIQKSYPDLIKQANSLIGNYLEESNQNEVISMYELEPFDIKVQSLERTFVDKVFALCDYYLENRPLRQSRHIYDIYKLTNSIDLSNLNVLINEVRKERQPNKNCPSAQSNISISSILNEIIDSNYCELPRT